MNGVNEMLGGGFFLVNTCFRLGHDTRGRKKEQAQYSEFNVFRHMWCTLQQCHLNRLNLVNIIYSGIIVHMSASAVVLLVESDASRALALRMAAERMGAKLFDFSQVESLDYFINDLGPSLIMINLEQYMDELPLLLALANARNIPVTLYGPSEKEPVDLLGEWGGMLSISYEKFPLRPLDMFKRILDNG